MKFWEGVLQMKQAGFTYGFYFLFLYLNIQNVIVALASRWLKNKMRGQNFKIG